MPGSKQPIMEQQAWILRSILTQLESQEAADEGAPNCISGEFARLKNQSTKYRIEKVFSTKTAEKQENIKKNRYKDIVPFDHTRVKLTLTTSKKDTDYINASYIKGVSGSRAYIATQGPLPHTLVDFLRMIWEYNINVIVMSCREFEMGKKKCEVYWPQNQEDTFICEAFTVHCDSEESKGDYLTRTLRLSYRNCSRTLKQLHYVNWPDHGVPDTIPPILDMLHEMRCYQAHDDIPICIHCSAGCGRTGALCVIDYTWNLLRNQTITSDFNIYNLVQDMRTQRPSVVQTKEQYLLVYRTIGELFRRYLQTMETQSCNTEVTMLQSAIAATSENDLSDESEELDLTPHNQHLLEEERGYFQQYSSPLALASENLTAYKYEDLHWVQQQYNPFQVIPEAVNATQDLHERPTNSPKQLHTNPAAFTTSESIPNKDDTSVLNPSSSPAVPEAVCLMVEDPYFDTSLSSPSSDEAIVEEGQEDSKWTCSPLFSAPSFLLNDQNMENSSPASAPADDEAPPPLPERTPESYFLAEEEELPDPCERLSVIFPPNAAAEPIREQAGSPPSPAPPLPERTPESFELASDPVPVPTLARVPLAVNLGVIGLSSEWSGTLTQEDAIEQEKTFVRSKSLRAKMTLSAPTSVMQLDQTNFHNSSPHLVPMTPPPLPHTEDSLASPVAKRVPESFPLPAETTLERNVQRPLSMVSTQPFPRVGMSSEWDGTSQPKKFLDAVMNRSKSVRAKSSRSEPLSAFPQLTPLPVVAAEGGSAQVEQQNINHRPTPNSDRSGSKADKSNEKSMLRSKSLKLFRHKSKPKTAPPPPPTQAGATPTLHSSSFTVFKFGHWRKVAYTDETIWSPREKLFGRISKHPEHTFSMLKHAGGRIMLWRFNSTQEFFFSGFLQDLGTVLESQKVLGAIRRAGSEETWSQNDTLHYSVTLGQKQVYYKFVKKTSDTAEEEQRKAETDVSVQQHLPSGNTQEGRSLCAIYKVKQIFNY